MRLGWSLLALPIARVTARDVYDFRQARLRAGAKPSTINRDLRTLRAMLKQARPDFKFPGAAFLPEDETRVRWLNPEEELLVFDAMPQATRPTRKMASRSLPFAAMARLAALTLMRPGELRTLKCEDVRLEQGVVMLFRRASRGAGLRGFTFHDLRHHGATMALNRGFSAPIVQALGGWKTERMMKRYAPVTDQTLRAAAEAVAGSESALLETRR